MKTLNRTRIVQVQRACYLSLVLSLALCFIPGQLFAQPNDFKQILKSFKNYRYGNVTFYELRNPNFSNVKRILTTKEKSGDSGALDKLDPQLRRQVESAFKRKKTKKGTRDELQRRGIIATPEIDAAIEFLISQKGSKKRIEKIYIITERVVRGETPEIIALIMSNRNKELISESIRTVSDNDILTYDELRARELDTTFGAKNLYDYVENAIIQGAVLNRTADAQGLASTTFAAKVWGDARSTIQNEANITPEEIQQFIRISEGKPQDYERPNEVVASIDLISYRRYNSPYAEEEYDDAGDDAVDPDAEGEEGLEEDFESTVYNNFLPTYGVELRYGVEDIYPSLWSERTALNAIWANSRVGVILPTGGWSSLDLGQDRKLTHGGFGINASFDFPIRVIRESGVFHTSFGYVFSDAEPASYKEDDRAASLDVAAADFVANPLDNDYLIRVNAQLHYTFAIQIDNDHSFRFGLGGSVYGVETWGYDLDTNKLGEDIIAFNKRSTETRGGISGKIEYMMREQPTPYYGASIQYFDEALSGGVWVQVPFTRFIAARVDAKAHIPILRDEHDWENESLIVPTASFIWNF